MRKDDRYSSIFGIFYLILTIILFVIYMITKEMFVLILVSTFYILFHIDMLIKTIIMYFDYKIENFVMKPKSVVVNLNGETILEQKEKDNG